MGKVISIVNRKGGVGKTTLTIGLADTLTGGGIGRSSVIVVDLDPQASSSLTLLHGAADEEDQHYEALIKADEQRRNLPALIEDRLAGSKRPIANYYAERIGPFNEEPYGLLANSDRCWDVELNIVERRLQNKLRTVFETCIKQLAEKFDHVLIDCPPGQTVLSHAAILDSDILLCPVVPDRLSFWGLQAFDRYLKRALRAKPAELWPAAFYVATRLRRGNFGPQHPQNIYLKQMQALRRPTSFVTLLSESGERSETSATYAILEEDSHMAVRTAGNPNPRIAWRYDRAYSSSTQEQLKNIVRWMKRELGDG